MPTPFLKAWGLDNQANRLAFELAHGDQKLLDIGIALALRPTAAVAGRTDGRHVSRRAPAHQGVDLKLWKAFDLTLVFIEHDMDMVFGIAQTVRVLQQGALLAEGTPEQIRANKAGHHRLSGRGVLMESILKAVDLNTYYGRSHILFNVSLEVAPGETVCLMGRNGVGKTTTFRSLMGLTPPRTGRFFQGQGLHRHGALPDGAHGVGLRARRPPHSGALHHPRKSGNGPHSGPQRPLEHRCRCSSSFRCWPKWPTAWAKPCPAASSRCSPSPEP
jgi:ABC-type branched-subunit amino acid transport system ATPase component